MKILNQGFDHVEFAVKDIAQHARTYERMGFLGAVNENYMISTVLGATTAYREQEKLRQEIPFKAFLQRRDS